MPHRVVGIDRAVLGDDQRVDIDAMIAAGAPIDADHVEHQLVLFEGSTAYPSAARLRALLRGQPDQPDRSSELDTECRPPPSIAERAEDRGTLPGPLR